MSAPTTGRAPIALPAPGPHRWALLLAAGFVLSACAAGGLGPLPAWNPTGALRGKAAKKDLLVLSQEISLRFDEHGAATRTFRIRYRLRTRAAVQRYDAVSATWAPWHEARPRLEATVHTPDGRRHRLAQDTIAVQPVPSRQRNILTDLRRLYAKLPALAPGAEVDLRIVERERRPLVSAGGVHWIGLASSYPSGPVRVVLTAPAGRPLHWGVRGAQLRVLEDRVRLGVRRVVLQGGPFLKDTLWEPGLPRDAPHAPHVLVSSARSWQAVADAYRRRIRPSLSRVRVPAAVRAIGRAHRHDRKALIAALLTHLHSRLRYTSLAFGERAIVPVPPATSLARGYGDCKDLSTILVGWLRALGIPAHLALLRAGTSDGVAPEYPGLDRFNHAVVFVPGAPPLWVDPTVRYARPGPPPLWIQDRWALVIRPGTRGLVHIPAPPPAENLYREVREIRFAPFGAGSVQETTRGQGGQEERVRGFVGDSERKDVEKRMKQYVRKAYLATRLDGLEYPPAADLRRPFYLRLRTRSAERAWTEPDYAKIQTNLESLFEQAGSYLLRPPRPGSKAFRRRHPFYLPNPYAAEIVYRAHAPPAYVLKTPPQTATVSLGPATYSVRITPNAARTAVTAVFRFDLRKRRWTAAEVLAFWRAWRRLQKELPPPELVFEHRAHQLAQRGDLAGEFALYRQLRRRYPAEPAYYFQEGARLVDLGYGAAGRRLLEAGARRFPKAAHLHFVLGLAYERDLYGNFHAPGWNRAAALRAYRRAVALRPKVPGYLRAYAQLLSVDDRGVPLRDPAALRPAVRAYQKLIRTLHDHSVAGAFAQILLRTRQMAPLERLLGEVNDADLNKFFRVAMAGLRRGPRAAEARARALAPDDAQVAPILATAGLLLLNTEHYGPARGLWRAFARATGAPPASLSVFDNLRSHRRLATAPLTHPATPARRLFYLALLERLDAARLRPRLASRQLGEPAWRRILRSAHQAAKALTSAQELRGKLTPEVLADLSMSDLVAQVEGSDALGYRVRLQKRSSRLTVLTLWVVKEGAEYRVRASLAAVASIGREVLARLRRGDRVAARKWLDWVRGPRRDPPDSPWQGVAFDHVWESGVAAPDWRIRLAAATLLATAKEHHDAAIALIRRHGKRLTERTPRAAVEALLANLYLRRGRARLGARLYGRLWKRHGQPRRLFLPYVHALLEARRIRTAERLARTYRRRHPQRWQSLLALSLVALARGDLDKRRRILDDLIATGRAPRSVYNNRAWLELFRKPFVPRRAIALAEKAVEMTQEKSASALDTLAVIQAEAGHLKEALAAFRKDLSVSALNGPKAHRWYLYGRVAEQLGLRDVAREAYERVPKPRRADPTSTWLLAQARLRALGTRPAAAGGRRPKAGGAPARNR